MSPRCVFVILIILFSLLFLIPRNVSNLYELPVPKYFWKLLKCKRKIIDEGWVMIMKRKWWEWWLIVMTQAVSSRSNDLYHLNCHIISNRKDNWWEQPLFSSVSRICILFVHYNTTIQYSYCTNFLNCTLVRVIIPGNISTSNSNVLIIVQSILVSLH